MSINLLKTKSVQLFDLPSGIRRRGNGVTARELAIVLQSGAVDDDLRSDSTFLDEIVETRIDDASAADKSSYMQVLKTLEERLAHVEKNGYSPLPKKGGMLTISSDDGDDEDQQSEVALSSSTAAGKKAKKKKKKQQQQTNAKPATSSATTTPDPPVPKSIPTKTEEEGGVGEDLSDPVAVALLGMGFTEDQIKSAARALGGFERATADDMVMWILGGGEIVDTSPASSATTPAPQAANDTVEQVETTSQVNDIVDAGNKSSSGDSEFQTKAQKKAAARAKRNAEDAAQKHQEEQATAQHATDKKEEQRRIRRQWNEREQARHEQEKSAKIAEQMERRRRADMEKSMPKSMMLPGGPPMSVQIPHGGPPMTIIAGGPKMPQTKSKNTGRSMGIPQAPNVRAPKILARPNNPPGIVPIQQPSMGIGNQPLFAGGAPPNAPRRSGGLNSPPRSIHAKPYKPVNQQQQQPVQILMKGPRNVANTGRAAPQAALPDYHYPPGHHPGPHMTNTSNVAPPQMQNASGMHHGGGSSTGSASSSYVEENPMGFIRATAREFVPTFRPKSTATEFVPSMRKATAAEFVPSMPQATANEFIPSMPKPTASGFIPSMPKSTAAEFVPTMPKPTATEFVPSMSAQPTTGAPAPAPISPMPPIYARSTSNNDNKAEQLMEPMSSLLSSFGVDTSAPPAVVGNKELDSTVPSAASSITGFSGLPTSGDDNNTSRVGSALTFESTGGIQTSSILETISYGVEQNNQPVGSGLGSGIGLWGGGGNNDNQTTSLAGLNFSSFMGSGDATKSDSNEGSNAVGGGTTWGAPTGSSIW